MAARRVRGGSAGSGVGGGVVPGVCADLRRCAGSMTRDHITYLVIVVLLATLGIWVARNTYWDDTLVPVPPQGEAATNSYYSVQHLATALGIRSSFIVSLNAAPPDKGALLMDGFQGDLSHTHVDALAPWVESGGRLIITDDVVRADPKFQGWSDIHLGAHFDYSQKSTPKITRPEPDDDCAPMNVAIDGQATGSALTLCMPPREFGLVSNRKPAWSLADNFGLQVLRVNIGRGSVT